MRVQCLANERLARITHAGLAIWSEGHVIGRFVNVEPSGDPNYPFRLVAEVEEDAFPQWSVPVQEGLSPSGWMKA